MREICAHSDICNSENHVVIEVKQEWISGAPVAIYIYIHVYINPKPEIIKTTHIIFIINAKEDVLPSAKDLPLPHNSV